jgi:Putative beta-barrel porin 2
VRPPRADRRDMACSRGATKALGRLSAVVFGGVVSAQLLLGFSATAFAQDAPPLNVPLSGVLTKGEGPSVGDWILYPSIGVFSSYSDNLFQSPTSPISTWAFGIDPSLVAEWSNGIHTSTFYGSAEGRGYPTESELNAFDDRVGWVQKYSPLPDLTFGLQGDYAHNTLATQLITALPSLTAPGTSVLANGNTVLPNGNIVSPTGQVVGQSSPSLTAANSTTLINPNDQLSATASVDKILSGGLIGLNAGVSRTEYQNTNLNPDFTVTTIGGRGAFSLGPMVYFYSNGQLALYETSSSFSARGGIGTRQIGLFSASGYFGRQGSEEQNSGSAGGNIYGGKLSYFPTPDLTFNVAFDEIINISSETGTSNLAISLPTPTALVIPIGASTRISSYSLQASYTISNQWSAFGNFGYVRTDYIDGSGFENAWLADGVLRYAMTRDITLEWEYQYSSIVSNLPLTSSKRNYAVMRATHKF